MSYRHRLSGQAAGPPILADAPSTLRVGFSPIFFASQQFWQIYAGDLLEQLETTIRRRPSSGYTDPARRLDDVIVNKCDWLEFYRIVELGAELSTHRGPKDYREKVNELLDDENIGWRLGKDDLPPTRSRLNSPRRLPGPSRPPTGPSSPTCVIS
jgi:hypothetical protein